MPDGRDVVSPIRRPREFARALGAMVAEQAGPRGRIVVLRNAVEGRTFSTAHKRQTVYHGPVAYLDDPYRRLESASSELELALLLVFLKKTARRAQREYRFAVWAEDEPAEDTLDLGVSAALVDAMGKPRPEPEGSGFVPGPAEYLSRARVETLPAFVGAGAAAARRGDAARRSARDGGRRMRRSRRYAKPSTRRTRAAGRTWQLRRGTPSRCCGSSPRRWVAGSPACG